MPTGSRPTPAAAFLVLLLPFGVAAGYVGVTLGFMLSKAGMPTAAVAAIIAYSVWPQTWKVFWAPIIDTTLNAKTWFSLGAVLTGLSILLLSITPHTLNNAILLTGLVIVSSLASTLVSMSSELFMAYGVVHERKGAVSGWSQAGNLGGSGIGGGVGLYLTQHVATPWVAGGVLAILCFSCCAALLAVDEPQRAARHLDYGRALGQVIADVWALSRSRAGLLVLTLMVLPMGSGGATGVWSAIAREWRVGADTVAAVNGVGGGLASLVGAVAAGFVCDRIDRRLAYCLFGLALSAVAATMAVLPRSPMIFVIFTLAYAFVLGACYAGYSAAVLDAIGHGAAATKFNLLASVSNIPVAMMVAADGAWHDQFGSTGMLWREAGAGIAAVAFMALLTRGTRSFGPASHAVTM